MHLDYDQFYRVLLEMGGLLYEPNSSDDMSRNSSSSSSFPRQRSPKERKLPSRSLLKAIDRSREEWERKTPEERRDPKKPEEWTEQLEEENIAWQNENGMMAKPETEEEQLLNVFDGLRGDQEKLRVVDLLQWSEIQEMLKCQALTHDSLASAIEELGIQCDGDDIAYQRISFKEVSSSFPAHSRSQSLCSSGPSAPASIA